MRGGGGGGGGGGEKERDDVRYVQSNIFWWGGPYRAFSYGEPAGLWTQKKKSFFVPRTGPPKQREKAVIAAGAGAGGLLTSMLGTGIAWGVPRYLLGNNLFSSSPNILSNKV